jgi:putative transposase
MNFIDEHIYHIYNRGNNKQLIFFKDENYRYFLRKARSSILPLADILAFCLMPNHFHFMVMVHSHSSDHFVPASALDSGQTSPHHFVPASALDSGQTNPHHFAQESVHDSGKLNIHPLVGKIAHMLSSYTRAINIQENRTGSLFTKKTKAKDITEGETSKRVKGFHPGQSVYALNCFHYIHQNPLKAGLVKKMEDWEFSSFREFSKGIPDGIINQKRVQEIIGFDIESFREQSYDILNEKDVEGIW